MSSLANPSVESLYRHHHPWLVALLNKKSGNRFDAYDLAHEVFVLLIKKPRSFDSLDGARNYLSVMANGLCVDLYRRRALESAWQQAMALRPAEVAPSPEQQAIILETLAEVAAMLEQLPAKVAEAFLMVHVDGLRYAEIAQQLTVSERMVKKYIATAMLHCALLRQSFSHSIDG